MSDIPVPLPADIVEAMERARERFDPTPPRVLYFASVTSTNDIASRVAAEGSPDGTAVVSDLQRAGRGRLGRTWYSPPGAGLYVSVVLRRPAFPALVTLAAGVALADAVRACTHLPVAIKWPNDLVVGRRKLAGILAEASGGDQIEYVVLGFGINLHSAAYPQDIADRATSIEAELGRPVDRGVLLVECLVSLAQWTEAVAAGRASAMLDRWRALSPSSRGARVEWTGPLGGGSGITNGIDEDGARLVQSGDAVERIVAGEVRWT